MLSFFLNVHSKADINFHVVQKGIMGQSYLGHLRSYSNNICQCFSGILFLSKINAFKQRVLKNLEYSDVEIGISVYLSLNLSGLYLTIYFIVS